MPCIILNSSLDTLTVAVGDRIAKGFQFLTIVDYMDDFYIKNADILSVKQH